MTPMRDITKIIDQCTAEILLEYDDLRGRLEAIKRSALYTAPELMRRCWKELCQVLNDEAPDPSADDCPAWAKRVQRIIARGE